MRIVLAAVASLIISAGGYSNDLEKASEALLENSTGLSTAKASYCVCKASCYKDTGDSAHFVKTYSVSCGLSTKEKKRIVLKRVFEHFIDYHGYDDLPNIQKHVDIWCYSTSIRPE